MDINGHPRLTIFIPTLNRGEAIRPCLDGIAAQSIADFEVIIVDGGSSDETSSIVNQYRDRLALRWIVQDGGLVSAANAAWKLAKGDIFVRTDDDAVPDPDWSRNILRTFDSDPAIGGVTGPTVVPESLREGRDLMLINDRLSRMRGSLSRLVSAIYHGYVMEGRPFEVSRFFRSGAFSLGAGYPDCLKFTGLRSADHLEACNMSVRKSLLDRIGGFDVAYAGIGDYHEPDVAFKIAALGYRLVFNPDVRVQHRPGFIGMRTVRPDSFQRSMNFILFYLRHIRLNSLDKLVRFSVYLAFQNVYWLYKAIMARDVRPLGGVAGTLVGLLKYRRAGRRMER